MSGKKKTGWFTWLVLAGLILFSFKLATVDRPAPQSKEQAVGAAEIAKESSERLARRNREMNVISAAQASIKSRLKDPGSAKFSRVIYREPGVACGYVNAKNSLGGYTGEKAFISIGSSGIAWLEDESKDFDEAWNEHCASN